MSGKDPFLTIFGVILIVFQLVAIGFNYSLGTLHFLIWFCNHIPLLLGIAFLSKNRYWINAVINISLIPQSLWTIDFLSKVLTDTYVFGFTSYMFSPYHAPALFYLSLSHLIITPIALIGLWRAGGPVVSWQGSLVHACILVPLSFLFDYGENLNCLRHSCVTFLPPGNIYALFWLLLVITTIIAVNYVLLKIHRVWAPRLSRPRTRSKRI